MFDKRKGSVEPDATPEIAKATVAASPTDNRSFNTRSTAMIGTSIVVKGSITGSENLVIDGTVEGSIDLPKNDLTIGESGRVTADLNAKVIRIDGQVTGDINGAEKVVISQSGKVQGNIISPRVTLEDGAKFKGSIDMDPGEPKATTAPPKPAAISREMPKGETQNQEAG
jgi:cytoskeletal protein CcmA (bactofilin family)